MLDAAVDVLVVCPPDQVEMRFAHTHFVAVGALAIEGACLFVQVVHVFFGGHVVQVASAVCGVVFHIVLKELAQKFLAVYGYAAARSVSAQGISPLCPRWLSLPANEAPNNLGTTKHNHKPGHAPTKNGHLRTNRGVLLI